MTNLKAIRDQAKADAERLQATLDSSGNQTITVDMLDSLSRTAREGLRLEEGGYRRDQLRALAQRVEVADIGTAANARGRLQREFGGIRR